jgi:hypothetical protein
MSSLPKFAYLVSSERERIRAGGQPLPVRHASEGHCHVSAGILLMPKADPSRQDVYDAHFSARCGCREMTEARVLP